MRPGPRGGRGDARQLLCTGWEAGGGVQPGARVSRQGAQRRNESRKPVRLLEEEWGTNGEEGGACAHVARTSLPLLSLSQTRLSTSPCTAPQSLTPALHPQGSYPVLTPVSSCMCPGSLCPLVRHRVSSTFVGTSSSYPCQPLPTQPPELSRHPALCLLRAIVSPDSRRCWIIPSGL